MIQGNRAYPGNAGYTVTADAVLCAITFLLLVVCIAYMFSNTIYHLTSITCYLHFKSFETNLNRVSCAESYEKWSVHVQSCKENFSFIIYVYSKKILLYIITKFVTCISCLTKIDSVLCVSIKFTWQSI